MTGIPVGRLHRRKGKLKITTVKNAAILLTYPPIVRSVIIDSRLNCAASAGEQLCECESPSIRVWPDCFACGA